MNSPALQLARFPDGGFVLHKLTFPGTSGRFSAWFDAKGSLLDAEQIRANGRCHPVKRNGPLWGELAIYGPRYVVRSV